MSPFILTTHTNLKVEDISRFPVFRKVDRISGIRLRSRPTPIKALGFIRLPRVKSPRPCSFRPVHPGSQPDPRGSPRPGMNPRPEENASSVKPGQASSPA
jgi:hypothetical protein